LTEGAGAASPAPGDAKGLEEKFINAIYGQESSSGKADTSKVNSQGVTGPMQIKDTTFDGMKKLGLIPQDADFRNPNHTLRAGQIWASYLLKKFNNDPYKAAAAYYAGEGVVAQDGTVHDWGNKKRPQDPTSRQYADQILRRMGLG